MLKPVDRLFQQAKKDKDSGICPSCGKPITVDEFKDQLSRQEYKIRCLNE